MAGIPEICGDVALSSADQGRYFLYGVRQIAQSLRRGFPVETARVDCEGREVQAKIAEGASPLRVYMVAVAEQMGAKCFETEGPICDIGCGAAGHSRLFENGRSQHVYVGIDIRFHARWPVLATSRSSRPLRFAQMAAGDLGIATGRLAFTFSSSVLEHVPNVRQAIGEIARTMRPGAYGLHVVPGVWSLFLYLFHGYRRFSPAGLADLFQDAGLKVERIWSMGGLPSFILHAVWITGMETILFRRLLRMEAGLRRGPIGRLYSRLLRLALHLDPLLPFAPAGYGVVVRKL